MNVILSMRRFVVALFLVSLAVVLVGGRTGRAEADIASVAIAGFVFSSNSITIAPGDTVTWTNDDTAIHDVTATGSAWTSGVMNQGDSFSHTFTDEGTFTYLCSLHPWMTGTVVVSQP
jgi:plastocyanin